MREAAHEAPRLNWHARHTLARLRTALGEADRRGRVEGGEFDASGNEGEDRDEDRDEDDDTAGGGLGDYAEGADGGGNAGDFGMRGHGLRFWSGGGAQPGRRGPTGLHRARGDWDRATSSRGLGGGWGLSGSGCGGSSGGGNGGGADGAGLAFNERAREVRGLRSQLDALTVRGGCGGGGGCSGGEPLFVALQPTLETKTRATSFLPADPIPARCSPRQSTPPLLRFSEG